MSLLERARKDLKRFLSNAKDWGVEVTLDNGTDQVTLKGVFSNHHANVEGVNGPVNSLKATITVPETKLQEANYPVRNGDGHVDMEGHLCTYTDSTGNSKTHVVQQTFPDETLGNIVIILGAYG